MEEAAANNQPIPQFPFNSQPIKILVMIVSQDKSVILHDF